MTPGGTPPVVAVHAYMRAAGWEIKEPGGPAGCIWVKDGRRIGVPYTDCDAELIPGVVNRLADAEGRDPGEVTRDILAGVQGQPQERAEASETLPAPARMAAEAAYRRWRIGGDGEGRLHAALVAYERERDSAVARELADLKRIHDREWRALWVLVRQFGGSVFLTSAQLQEIPPLASLGTGVQPDGMRVNASEEP